MEKLREWLGRMLPGKRASVPARKPMDTQESRDSRAYRVLKLQAEVSRLQQRRLELSNTAGSTQDANVDTANEMESIERALDTARTELNKLQARI
jgi:ABC-type phosphate transport system auxiliary subunit